MPDSGSLAGDVRGFLTAAVAQFADPRIKPVVLDVFVETTRTPALAQTLHDVVAEPRRAAAAAVLDRAIERGELSAELDRELGLDLLISPLLMRMLFAAGRVDDAYLTRLARVVVTGLGAM